MQDRVTTTAISLPDDCSVVRLTLLEATPKLQKHHCIQTRRGVLCVAQLFTQRDDAEGDQAVLYAPVRNLWNRSWYLVITSKVYRPGTEDIPDARGCLKERTVIQFTLSGFWKVDYAGKVPESEVAITAYQTAVAYASHFLGEGFVPFFGLSQDNEMLAYYGSDWANPMTTTEKVVFGAVCRAEYCLVANGYAYMLDSTKEVTGHPGCTILYNKYKRNSHDDEELPELS